MYWLLYLLFLVVFILLLGKYFDSRAKFPLFVLLIVLITPSPIDIGSNNYAPSIFTFIFSLVLEQNYSLRPLRPLVISLPISLSIYFIYKIIKKRLF